MNVHDAIIQRRSYRGEFQNRQIDKSDLNRILEAARWTPSPFNVQPWELLIIQASEGKDFLAKMTEQAVVEQFKDSKFLEDNSQWMCLDETECQRKQNVGFHADDIGRLSSDRRLCTWKAKRVASCPGSRYGHW